MVTVTEEQAAKIIQQALNDTSKMPELKCGTVVVCKLNSNSEALGSCLMELWSSLVPDDEGIVYLPLNVWYNALRNGIEMCVVNMIPNKCCARWATDAHAPSPWRVFNSANDAIVALMSKTYGDQHE